MIHLDASRRKAHRLGPGAFLYQIGKFIFVGVLFILFFLLAHDMAQHRFTDGGWYTRNGTIRP